MKNQTKKTTFTEALILLLFQIVISVLPGFLILLKENRMLLEIFLPLFFFLLLCELFQFMNRNLYKEGKHLPIPLIFGKILLSCLFIYYFAEKTNFWYGLILLTYEGTQLMQFSKTLDYMDMFSYTFMNSFFKGIVFNSLLCIQTPFTFQITLFQPFLFSFCTIFLLTAYMQKVDTFPEKSLIYTGLTILAWLALLGILFVQLKAEDLSTIKFSSMLILHILSGLLLIIKQSSTRRTEVILYFFMIINLILYYI